MTMFSDPGENSDASGSVPINEMAVADLLALRAEIDKHLPATSLAEMNLEQELVIQFLVVKELQTEVLASSVEESNKKAQVCNTVASTMQQLVKMQTELHTSERFKVIENLMIKYMKKLPREVAEAFLDEYELISE